MSASDVASAVPAAVRPAEAGARALSRWRERPGRGPVLIAGLAVVMCAALVALAVGSVAIPAATIAKMLAVRLPFSGIVPDWPASYEAVLWEIRMPRVALAGLVGASLATSGATYQGLFRNPLADPYLIGVAAGAALGAVLAIVVPAPPLLYSFGLVQAAAFVTAIATVAAVYGLARVGRTAPVTTLLLAGVALGAFASAITSFLMYVHGERLLAIYSWLLGGFALSNWQHVLLTLPYTAVGMAIMWLYARPLNVLQLDEEQAVQLGLNVERLKLILVGAATLVTASAVAASGLVGFVGLIVPHAVRLIWGPDYRFLLPMSAIGGAIFLTLADMLGRVLLAPSELPVGVVTAFCGAPFFLYLLRQQKRMVF